MSEGDSFQVRIAMPNPLVFSGSAEPDLPRDVPSAKSERALWSDDEENADCDEQPTERWHS